MREVPGKETVSQAIETHALTPEAVEQVIRVSERDDVCDQHEALMRERRDFEKRISRVRALVETGAGDVVSLVDRLRELQARCVAVDAGLQRVQPVR